jgi:hypothetical protein
MYIAMPLILIVAFTSFIFMTYYSYKCWKEMTASAQKWVGFMPFIMFLPSSYSDIGKKYYNNWAVSMFVVVISFSALFILGDLSGYEATANE